MLRLKLIREDEQEVIYNYYPENKNVDKTYAK